MPPFKAGLLKRKAGSAESGRNAPDKASDESEEELPNGAVDGGDDATDSEHEDGPASDNEQDGVLFEGSDDSTFGDDGDQADIGSDESSDITDSEDDDDSEEETDGDEDSDDEESVDSGAESGIAQTADSDSSDSDKQKHQAKTKQKPTVEKAKLSKGKQETEKAKEKETQLKQKQSKTKQGKQSQSKGKDSEEVTKSIDRLADSINKTSVEIRPVGNKDEYESGDTSDEEDRRNTVGDVPMWWYNEYPHLGYDLDGRKIVKPPQRDQIDEFLKKCEDPEFWRTVRDPSTGQDVVLSKQDLELIQRLRAGQAPAAAHDEYAPWVEWFTREVLAAPLRAFPDHKRSFLPSRSEQQQVARLVHALKMGWTKTRRQLADERRNKRERKFYNLWGSAADEEEARQRGVHKHIAPPKRPPPTHAESYNPPPEYLLDSKELKEWNKLSETPWKRKYTFLPTQYKSLREVPAYDRYTRERFLRCLDLYLAPRAIKMRLTISPEDLIPKLPSPRDLQPFPTSEALVMRGHVGLVRSCDFDPSGQYAVSGGDDCTVRVWETSTGRCLRTVALGEPVARVAWTPSAGLSLVAVALGARLLLLNPGADIGAHRVAARTDSLLEQAPPAHDVTVDARTAAAVTWEKVPPEDWARGVRIAIHHFKPVTHVSWHARGDYVAATLREGASRAVVVHQTSRRRSQLPLARARGLVQCAVFHPLRPLLLVATQRAVRVYDLLKQELVRKLRPGAQWISHLAVHPRGDNVLVASYDRKCVWFDLELSSEPYQTLRLHAGAVRAVAFHPRYPLFASAGDDHNIVVSHGMVYNDLLQNPLLVPLKQLRAGSRREELCVLELRFHPVQPWLLAAGADGALRLYS